VDFSIQVDWERIADMARGFSFLAGEQASAGSARRRPGPRR